MTPSELERLAATYGTDKRMAVHGYSELYHRHLGRDRFRVRAVLELGVYRGASLATWRGYFPLATIHGLDTNLGRVDLDDTSRIVLHQGDQADPRVLQRLVARGPFDLVVDDGSHRAADQLASWRALWPAVSPGGWYVVEDTCTSYWPSHGGGWPRPAGTILDHVCSLVDDVNLRGHRLERDGNPSNERQPDRLIADLEARGLHPGMDTTVEAVTIASSTVIVRKRGQL